MPAMRWAGQRISGDDPDALPGLRSRAPLVRTVRTPEFAGITFHEVLARTALNHVPAAGALPFAWTINPYRGCSHACTFCFARRTHEYLDFDSGRDFDREIVVKVNIVDVLARELARPSWGRHPVALGTNTDPYQRAEGRYALMPDIVEALAASGTPFSILTKGTLLRRDIPLLVAARERVSVEVAMTIDMIDGELQSSVEPGAPSTAGRLATVRALAEAGFEPAVFVMPVLPFLTDGRDHLDRLFAAIADAGASTVAYTALHLRPGAREWYFAWLEREHPGLVPRYRQLYASGASAPLGYRRWLAARVRPLLRAHGLDRPARIDPATGSPAVSARSPGRDRGREAVAPAELAPPVAEILQPTLF